MISPAPGAFPRISLRWNRRWKTNARLLVIDPIMAFLDQSVSAANDHTVRRALTPLAALAERCSCAILFIRHLVKGSQPRALYRGGGSIGLVGACRSAWLVAAEPGDPARRVFAQLKNNLAPAQPSLLYTLQPRPHAPPAVHWLGESTLRADQLLAARTPHPGLRQLAADFLKTLLHDGPKTRDAVLQAGAAQGFSSRTLDCARNLARIHSRTAWIDKKPVTFWRLPHQPLPPSATLGPPDLEPYLAPLRAKYGKFKE